MSGRFAGKGNQQLHCHIETVLGHDSSIPGVGELRAGPVTSILACNDKREL